MNNKPNLTSIRNRVALSDTEKAEGRGRLLAHMALTPAAPVVSPFSWMQFTTVRIGAAFLVLVMVGGTGIVSASEKALPGEVLYGVKLQIAEPTRLALTFNRKEKAKLELAYADRRLKEFTAATIHNKLSADDSKLIAASLEDRIDGVGEGILALTQSGEGDDAYIANEELQGVLQTHARIIDKVAGTDPVRISAAASIRAKIAEEIEDSDNSEPSFDVSIDDLAARGVLGESVTETQADVITTLGELHEDIGEAVGTLDDGDRATLSTSLEEVNEIIEDAKEGTAAGDPKAALRLYKSADGKLDELKALIEAEGTLGIDLIDGAE